MIRFAGNYHTQLRVKLETSNCTYYSAPYGGWIDYGQIENAGM